MKCEFETLLGREVSDDTYKKIEHVYTFHPCIKNKADIVMLYDKFGMRIINDMTATASKAMELESKRDWLNQEAQAVQKHLDKLARGEM
jgi:hypothetical protein